MKLSAANLELLRTRPQTTKLYLSIFQPVAIFKAQVNNASAAKGDRVITFDSVSLGLYTYIQDGMTMWIGRTPGGMEVGKVRVRSATSTTITVSENSDISWADNLYLTIFRYWELWPVYPRIIQNPSNIEDVIFYKDYDIAYTNQNSILGTYVNAGPHRAALLDPASGQTQIYYSSTGSYNLLGDSLNYNWFFEGATVTGSSSANPGYITYNTPGHYVTRLSISGSSGGVDTTYRYVSIYNQANPPIAKWTLNSLQGSRDEGGYSASFKVFQTIPIQEHAVVVIFGQNEYGSTQVNLGGNFPNAGDILFVGYVDKDSISYDYQHSEMSFDAMSLTDAMKKSSGFGVSVKSVLTPTKWYELLDMDGRRALYHYLRWHTTALMISDFQFVGNDYKVQFFDSDRESMYDAINNYMQNGLVGKVVSDRQGKVWMEVDAMAYPNPTGTFSPPVMDITNRDWMNSPSIEERLTNEVSYMEWGGVAYSGVNTGTFAAVISETPGNAPGFYGTVDSREGLVLESQLQLNRMAGNVFANKNSNFPNIGLDMGINAANLDIAPQETVGVHIAASDTVRNVAIDGLYIPDGMSWKYDPRGFNLLPTVDVKELVNGDPGTTVIIPDVSDIGGGYTSSGYDTLNLPPLPNIFSPTTPSTGDGAPAKVIVHDPTAGLCFTQTFNTPSPVWYQVNAGLTVAQYQSINRIVVCPNGATYVGHIGGNTGQDFFIARASYPGSTFVIVEDQASINAKMGTTGLLGYVITFNCRSDVAESVVYTLGRNASDSFAYIGANTTWSAGLGVPNSGQAGSVSYGLGQWLFTSNGGYWVMDANVTSILRSGSMDVYVNQFHLRAGVSGKTVHFTGVADTIAIGTDNDTSVAFNVGSQIGSMNENVLAGDVTMTYLMGWGGPAGGRRWKSSDGGYSWSVNSNLPVLVAFFYCCVDAARWIAAGSYIWYTNDFGISFWKDKQGNLNQINSLFSLDVVEVVP